MLAQVRRPQHLLRSRNLRGRHHVRATTAIVRHPTAPSSSSRDASTCLRQSIAASVATAALLLCPQHAVAEELQGTARVVDGDTLAFGTDKVRLFGVDAPESKQACSDAAGRPYACGQVSAEKLSEKLQGRPVSCQVKNKDQYGRSVASCSVGQEDIGSWLVKNGYAVAYKQFSREYVPYEAEAQAAKRGIWQGSFQTPSEWRKANKAGTAATISSTPTAVSVIGQAVNLPQFTGAKCPNPAVKGNINSSGEKIYHVPGGLYYSNVVIDEAAGEKLFCTETDAQAAGWRASSK